MSSPPPTKPPRGVKQGKETSGLLMSVIRTLSASETNEQREKERAKLEKEYKKSDARLDELVAAHAQEIMEVMQKFSAVGEALSVWGQHCDAAVARLAACRGLLRMRRDDLRRLWSDARTHHYALQMLTDIERVAVSERVARAEAGSGRVLGAAHTLSAALATADTTLAHVDALLSTRHHLQAKKKSLVEVILRRISDAVYRSERAPLTRRVSARRRTALLLAELTKSEEVTDEYLQDITPEFEASLSEDDKTFETTVMISLEALGVLDQLKEATEKFKVQIQTELLEVIDSVSRRIIEEGDVDADNECEEDGEMCDGDGVTESGRPLARLVASLGEEFRACGARNKRLVQLWRAALQKHKLSDCGLHTDHHYWSAVQQVLQLLLTEYLQIESVNLAAQRSSGAAVADTHAHSLRIADYFAKKRPQRRRTKLFKLTEPSSPLPPAAGRPPARAVCPAHPAHLHVVLPSVRDLCHEIETQLGGGECSLRAFITEYVRTGESERLANAARAEMEDALRGVGAHRERGPPPGGAKGDRNRCILRWCGRAWVSVVRAALFARRCGTCGGQHALVAARAALVALAGHARTAHRTLVPHSPRAARWLADDDIVRFLQALPNWRAATATDAIDPQELKQAYEREAEILGSSLGDGAVSRREIIADTNVLIDIAVLCESMDWLSTNVRTIPSLVSGPSGSGEGLKVPDKFVADVNSAAMVFDEIAHKCLLLLHLEMRIECFHYLGQEEREGAEEGGADGGEGGGGGAARLAHQLLAFHERADGLLAPARMAYILNGIGEMMSSAFIWRWRSSEAAGSATARLATLRHCLAALRLPHSGLHTAHTYLHMLGATPEEIIASVREKGAQFSELEYLNAFKVIGARLGRSQADMRAQLKHLSAALGHVGVTV